MSVLATPANMRKYQREDREIHGHKGVIVVRAQQPVAYSFDTGETFSATPGDYFMLGDDEPLTDSDDNPCYLVFERTQYVSVDGED